MLKETTLTPFLSLGFDAMALFGVSMIVAAAKRLRWLTGLLFFAGLSWLGLLVASPSDLLFIFGTQNLVISSAWLSALLAMWGFSHIEFNRVRAIAFAALIAGALLPVARGITQYTVEHNATMAEFNANRTAALEAQGFVDGTAAARAFERRLSQREATGWIGLSNVYATITGMLVIVLALLAFQAWRAQTTTLTRQEKAILFVCSAAAFAALFMTHSKGGHAAAAFAAITSVAYFWLARRTESRRIRHLLPPAVLIACICVPLFAIVARGILGDALSERSLLFRWHYLVASWDMLVDPSKLSVNKQTSLFPAMPTTPDGYKSAYLLYKVPTNPEAVSSPHSLFFDWLAKIGPSAAPWLILGFLVTSWNALRSVFVKPVTEERDKAEHESARRTRLLAILATVLPLAFALFHQTADLQGFLLLALIFALLIAIALAWSISALVIERPRLVILALISAALVLITHMQYEMTGTRTATCVWVFCLLGLSASFSPPFRFDPVNEVWKNKDKLYRRLRRFAKAYFFVLALVGPLTLSVRLATHASSAHSWESILRDAAHALLPIAVANTIERSGPAAVPQSLLDSALAQLDAPPPNPASPLPTLRAAAPGALEHASNLLSRLAPTTNSTDLISRDQRLVAWSNDVWSERVRLDLLRMSFDSDPRRRLELALQARTAAAFASVRKGTPSSNLFAARINQLIATEFTPELLAEHDPETDYLLDAESYFDLAVALAPHEIRPAQERALFLAALRGREAEAAEAARLALRNNDLHALDPLVQLTDAEVDRLKQIASRAPQTHSP